LSVRATGHPVWNRARAIAVGHALEARAPPATCSTPCPVLRCSCALRYQPYPRATQLHQGESLFASPSLAPASLAVHRCNAEYTKPVSSSIRRFSPRFTTAAAPSYHPHPSSLRRNLPQTGDRREELPEASQGRPPSTSMAPRCGQCTSNSEQVCRHLPELGTGVVLLSDPQAKLLDGLRHPAPPAYSCPSAPSWRLSPGESPTAPLPQFECPPSRHSPRPAPSTGLAAGCRNRPVPPPPERHGRAPLLLQWAASPWWPAHFGLGLAS
jgi:hypothetical protein